MTRPLHAALGSLIEAVGTDDFWRSLALVCSSVASSSAPMIYTFSRAGHPHVLFPQSKPEARDEYIGTYLRAAYSTDPYYTKFLDGIPKNFYTLREIAPDNFYQTEYFNEYYRHTNVADDAAFLVPLEADTAVHISLTRDWSEPSFSPEEVEALRALQPVVTASIQRHSELRSQFRIEETASAEEGSNVENAFESFGDGTLTPRESEVARLLLRGLSPRSISDQLGVSIETVRNHRKSVYRKFDVSSHSELFGKLLDEIDSLSSR